MTFPTLLLSERLQLELTASATHRLWLHPSRYFNEMSAQGLRARTVSSPIPYTPSPSSSRPISPGRCIYDGIKWSWSDPLVALSSEQNLTYKVDNSRNLRLYNQAYRHNMSWEISNVEQTLTCSHGSKVREALGDILLP